MRGRRSDGGSEGLEGSFERTVTEDFDEDLTVEDGGDAKGYGCGGGGCVVGSGVVGGGRRRSELGRGGGHGREGGDGMRKREGSTWSGTNGGDFLFDGVDLLGKKTDDVKEE